MHPGEDERQSGGGGASLLNRPVSRAETNRSSGKVCAISLLSSYVIWSLLALLVLDSFLRISWSELPVNHYASANRSMVSWAVDSFRRQKKSPELVLMGSSLLMHALHGGDADYLNMPQNEVFHSKSVLLESLLREKTGSSVHSFAFALAGMMASDAFVLGRKMFSDQTPKVIVYGIAPRDFMDNTLDSPGSTEIFRYVSRLGGTADCAWAAHTGFWERVEYLCEQASFIYGHRNYFVYLQQKYERAILRRLGFKLTDEVHTPFALRRLALLELPEDIGSNERIVMPGSNLSYTDNSVEYLRRYRPFKEKRFDDQLSYLDKFMGFCKNRGIELVIVNMPVTADNIKLLPDGCYGLYLGKVQSLTRKYALRFIDLQDSSRFKRDLYCDTAHMNGKGGVVFFKALAEELTGGKKALFGAEAARP